MQTAKLIQQQILM